MPAATILAVDDDPLQLDLLEVMLVRLDYRVLRALTGEDALHEFAQHLDIDLVLLDVLLPGQLDGLDVCRQIRTDSSRPYVPVIMLTALGKTEQIAHGLESGADDYITKPFNSRELIMRIQAALRIRRIQHELVAAQNRFQVLVETSRDLIFALNLQQQLTYVSPICETLTGYPAETLLTESSPFARVIHPDDAPRWSAWRAQLTDRPDGADLEFRIVRADGQVRWCTLSWSTIIERDGSPIGIQGTLRDITHRREVEAANWRRSQDLGTLNLIASHLNQSLELAHTLDEALNALLEIVAAEFGSIHVVAEDQLTLRTAHGWSPRDARLVIDHRLTFDPQDWADLRIIREKLDDMTGAIRFALKGLGIQCVLQVPLRERGTVSGVLTLAARQYDKFDAAEVSIISTVAEQINAAIVNARLYDEARQHAGELEVLYEIGRMLTSTLDLNKVLRVIMEATANVLQTESGSVLLLDENTQELIFAAAVGVGADTLPGVRLPPGAGIAGQALRENRTILIEEPEQHLAFYPAIDKMTGTRTQRLIAVPLRAKDKFIGVMEVINKRTGRFTTADVRRVNLLAPTAAAAIDNARLYARELQLTEEVRRHNRELSTLHAISAALSQSLEIKDVMEAALVVLRPQFEYDDACITVTSQDQTYASAYQAGAGITPLEQVPVAQRIAQQAIQLGTVQLLPDTRQVAPRLAAACQAARIAALAAVPLWSHDQVQGCLTLVWRQARYFEREAAQLFAAIGQQIGVAIERATLHEVSQRHAREIERSYAQLVQSEKLAATGRLAMSLAHEINNPLQAIQNCLHLVLEFSLDDERKTYYLKLAREEVERLSILAQSMLDFYRPSRSEQPLADVRTVTERVLNLAEQKLRLNHIEVSQDFPAIPLAARIAPDQLAQVCLNLIMNAAEAMEQGGRLHISAQSNDEIIWLHFADSGPGIAPEVLEHIFEPFYSTKDEGTGLGLAISYTILERLGGLLQVSSALGQGTTFTVQLPRTAPEPEANRPEHLIN